MLSKKFGQHFWIFGQHFWVFASKVGFVVALVWFKPNLSNHVGLALIDPMDIISVLSPFWAGVGACVFKDPRVER